MKMIVMLILCLMCVTPSFATETAVKIVNGGIQFPTDGSTQNKSATPPVCADGEVLTSYSGSWHCGSIKIVANGVATCTQGGCAINACVSGFKSCDNNTDNGCETNLLTSSQHCGTCGYVCPGFGACEAGVCINPVQLISLTPSTSALTVGESASLLVTMSKAVPSDFFVVLSSNSPATVSVPSGVTILAGQSTAQYFASAIQYGSATITASALGNNVTAQVNVVPAVCGDGFRVGPEACDDGNTTDGDGCSSTCQIESGFSCSGSSPSSCNASCGDGLVAGGEQCDDGNNTNGDGCSSTCSVEPNFVCNGQPSACESTIATMLSITGLASPVSSSTPVSLTIMAKNAAGNIASGYRGTINFSSTDPSASLPASYTFTAFDGGQHFFSGVMFNTAGARTITVNDIANAIFGSQGITVNP